MVGLYAAYASIMRYVELIFTILLIKSIYTLVYIV